MARDVFSYARETVNISGRAVRLRCSVGRDMMPGVFPDRRLGVAFRLDVEGGGALGGEWVIDEAWFRAGERIARASVKPLEGDDEWDFNTREGPDWDDPLVDVVAHLTDGRGGEHYLLAGGVRVGYCW